MAFAVAGQLLEGETAHGIFEFIERLPTKRAVSGFLFVVVVIVVVAATGAAAMVIRHSRRLEGCSDGFWA